MPQLIRLQRARTSQDWPPRFSGIDRRRNSEAVHAEGAFHLTATSDRIVRRFPQNGGDRAYAKTEERGCERDQDRRWSVGLDRRLRAGNKQRARAEALIEITKLQLARIGCPREFLKIE